MACTSSAECAEITDGCCMGSTVESFAEDSTWGTFAWSYGDSEEAVPVVGETYTLCASAAFQANFETWEQPTTQMMGFEQWLSVATTEEMEALGLFEGDDATYWVESWGSDVYTMENFMITVACVDSAEAEEAASALVAASATLLAVALLN